MDDASDIDSGTLNDNKIVEDEDNMDELNIKDDDWWYCVIDIIIFLSSRLWIWNLWQRMESCEF